MTHVEFTTQKSFGILLDRLKNQIEMKLLASIYSM